MPGARAHGSVTGVQEYGVFVAFCGGVRGLAPISELGLEPGQDPAKHFAMGKVGHRSSHALALAPATPRCCLALPSLPCSSLLLARVHTYCYSAGKVPWYR